MPGIVLSGRDKNIWKNQAHELLYHWAQRTINSFSGHLVFCCPSSDQSDSHNLLSTNSIQASQMSSGAIVTAEKEVPTPSSGSELG